MVTFAIIGRPNVGKSTLFNRIAGRRLAIVDDFSGVTRDRKECNVERSGLSFSLIDTAGLEIADVESLAGRMQAQTEKAIALADACLFLVDARAGITPMDFHFARILHKTGKPVILLANKCEGVAGEAGLTDSFGLGLGVPIPISAEHGDGLPDLYEALRFYVDHPTSFFLEDCTGCVVTSEVAEESKPLSGMLRVAVCGRPNVGKSTLINCLIGEERLLTGSEAGITRDSIEIPWMWRGRPVLLHDTAGMRRKSRIAERLEKASVGDSLNAIKFAHAVIVLIDATCPFEQQDLHIASLVASEGRAVVIGVNKWDQVKGNLSQSRANLEKTVLRLLPQIRGVSLVPVSAKTGQGLDALMKAVFATVDIWDHRIPTAVLNRFLGEITASNPPPAVSGRRIRLRYMTQPKARPPTFVIFSQRADGLPESYLRYIINRLRDTFGLIGTPIRVHLRKGDNPYAGRKP